MYNDLPIKNVALQEPNVYAQLDSDGVVVSLDTISTTMNSSSIIISGGGGFKYSPKQTLIFESSLLPTPVLPYQELFAVSVTTSPVTYTASEGYLILYDGGSHPSFTLNTLGQNVTLSISDESTIYFVIAVSGSVTFNN
jgi:hypothetical protein